MGFRAKFIMFLIVYFAGIATGIYLVIPSQAQMRSKAKTTSKQQEHPIGAFKSNGATKSARNGMDNRVAAGKSTSDQVSEIIKAYTGNQDAQP